MHFEEGYCYHIYNRGSIKQDIFFSNDNYIFFLRKVNDYLAPVSDILSWCLMPNHFHFLIYSNNESIKITSGIQPRQQLTENIRLLLSSYTKAINKQRGFTGSLFQPKTKAKLIDYNDDHLEIAFHYVHQNPLAAGLVKSMEDWKFSSFNDYAGLRKGNLCNMSLARELINLDSKSFVNDSYRIIEANKLKISGI
jgi:putative transposase